MIQTLRIASGMNLWLDMMIYDSQVTIDGPAATGKTTVGKIVADQLGWRFLDTGVMYRAATKVLLEANIDLKDKDAMVKKIKDSGLRVEYTGKMTRLFVAESDITDHLRDNEVESKVSLVSEVLAIRELMVLHQRQIAKEGPIVMVGRDIGSVVLPNAKKKIYLDASARTRALRRIKDTKNKTVDDVTKDIILRDKIDSERDHAPLRIPIGAYKIDTDRMTIDQVVSEITKYISM